MQHARSISQFIAIPAGFYICCERFQSLRRRNTSGIEERDEKGKGGFDTDKNT